MKPLCVTALLACVVSVGRAEDVKKPAPAAPATRTIEFNRDVRPIFSDACFACHGFDPKARKGKLRLDVPDGAFTERDGAFPIKPGAPNASEVWKRIVSDDADSVMPPPHTNKKLTAAQKETIRLWIEQGAKYQKHWSFEPVARQAVPGAGHPVDAFIRARLEKEGLKPTAAADRETLIRRASFALTGLPPTVAEVDAFLSDKEPGAYERLVDRYLASPRFGEEMARHWLDVARYADTHGLHLDNERQMWKYRDWVVKAFNDNLPFDTFATYQLAGDLLPNPTSEQLTATGFSRCNVTTGEGGSIDAEWLYRNAVDRASTATQAFLGLTAGCAVCHDHKFDPISIKEYYSLYAFFYSGADPALDSNVSTTGPFVKVPTPAQQAALEAAAKAEAGARKALEEAAAKAAYTDPAATPDAPAVAVREVLLDDTFPAGATSSNTTRNAADWVTAPAFGAKSGRRVLRQANTFFHQDTIQFRNPLRAPAGARFEAWVYLDPKQPPGAVTVQFAGGKKVWWGQEPTAESPYARGGLGTRVGDLPKPGSWAQLALKAEDLGLKGEQPVPSLTLQEHGGVVYWDAVALAGTSHPATDPRASFQVWWKGLNGKAPPGLPAGLNAVVAVGPAKNPKAEDVAKLRAYYLAHVARGATPALANLQQEWEAARAEHAGAADAIPGTMVFRDLPVPRDSFVMLRGQYDKPGDKVQPGVPAALPPLKLADPSKRATRLDLANWITSPENPLAARVAANRLWQQFFGVGLVKTSSDFGSQGEPPSHPELLDWLAAEYRASWDTKKFVKLLVTSDAFKRDAAQPPAVRLKDPENQLLSRGPRFRLDAEQLRDNALFVSGLMSHEMGGRGVNVYQPPNIWEPVGYADSNTRYYLQDHGAALYRRSLYVFIKRTAPAPFLTNFDATNREQLCAGRDRTNTPLQALQLMNDVQHFEAARALAERVLTEGGKQTEERIAFLYRTVLSRRPDAEEVKLVAAALERQRELFAANPAGAKKVVHAGESKPKGAAADAEVAAWAMVANLVLNLDEAVSRN
ncbi:PSD1 and planctomycete cytochrome C domain-containing protein [Gemmata sp. JC673]|uniref:PSD1 and planctomycete cytochrome C domain-containing protein n=1 Tax=Gemmata algarum TaxID=2975278 RepID=A0ABU5FA47_9BACT|nr:PSD1 and planctomycete cytochrome C domain-containing protein [Gemmata algarum]MDY3563652.1 PSD1 and planctomycete cytochrome C domain-containing protein [Gemmata algarum]